MQESSLNHSLSLFSNRIEPESFELKDADLQLIQHFYPPNKADLLLTKLINETTWQQDYLSFGGKEVLIPRLQSWVGDASSDYGYSGLRLKPAPWSRLLSDIRHKIEDYAGAEFNSVLLNYYRDGNDSVAWHSDDEKELGENPIIASLSLGTSRIFQLKHRTQRPTLKHDCLLDNGSLLLMGQGLQKNWQHQIPKQRAINTPRINLTFRKIIL